MIQRPRINSNKLIIFCFTFVVACVADHGSNQPHEGKVVQLVELNVPTTSPQTAPTLSEKWQELWWLNKASRALRGGNEISHSENTQTLLGLGKEAVVKQFLDDPRFADSILDFALFYVGFRLDNVRKENGSYNEAIYESPNVISAARSILESTGNFLSIFEINQPIYMGPLVRPGIIEPSDAQLDSVALRAKQYERMQADIDAMLALANQTPLNGDSLCAAFNAHTNRYLNSGLFNWPPSIPRKMFFSDNWYGKMNGICNGGTIAGFDFVSTLKNIKTQNQKFIDKIAEFEPKVYKIKDLGSLKTLDITDLQIDYVNTSFSFTFGRAVQNSSTNYNRKRAAYYLSRFFCDDLTPINVETPEVHAGDAHGSATSCLACHYKLDPMAGFFRNFGRGFKNYANSKNLTFDDGVRVVRSDYEKAWAPGPDATHPLNIGYIRSTQDLTLNSYGSTYPELVELLKTAPEVRQCLVRRLFEFFVGEDQTVDNDYIAYLTENFNSIQSKQGTTPAIKNTVAQIVLSKSFATFNASRDTCYDYRPQFNPAGAVPCRVASLLRTSCTKCHNSLEKEPFLNLNGWEKDSSGSFGFPHRRASGEAYTTKETLQMMLERISSTDDDERMPQRSEMPTHDRQELYKWLNDRLAPDSGAHE